MKNDTEERIKQHIISTKFIEQIYIIINNMWNCTQRGAHNLNTLQTGTELKIKALTQFTKLRPNKNIIHNTTFYNGFPR